MDLVRLRIHGDRVDGEQLLWLTQTIPDRDVNPSWRAFMDSVPTWLQERFDCPNVVTDTLHFPEAQAGYRNELVAVCTRRFRREPDWRALLRQLEAHQVWTLPDASELPTIGNIMSLDGSGLTVEAWDGTRYHTYSVGATELIPAREARELGELQRVLLAFFKRLNEQQR